MADAPQFPTRISSSPFERPKISLARIVSGDVSGAARALVDPNALAPSERVTLADKWGLGGDDWYRSILRMVENPLVLVGMVMAVRYPIPTAKNLFNFAPQLTGLARNVGWARRMIGGLDETFHGLKAGKTTLPQAYKSLLNDVQVFRESYGKQMAQAIAEFESAGGVFDKRAQVLLVAKLKGQDRGPKAFFRAIEEGPAFDRLAGRVKMAMDDVYENVFKAADKRAARIALRRNKMTPEDFAALVDRADSGAADAKQTLRVILRSRSNAKAEILEQLRNSGFDTRIFTAKRLKNYFPERMTRSALDFEKQTQEMVAVSERDWGRRQMVGAGTTQHAKERLGKMVPNPDDLDLVKDHLIDGTLPTRLRSRMRQSTQVRPYSYQFNQVMSSYLHSVSRAYGWTVRGHGHNIVDAMRRLESSSLPHNKIRAAMLRDSYIPVALGRQTYKQMLQAAQWDDMRLNLVQSLSNGPLKTVLPGGVNKWLTDRLISDGGLFAVRNLQGRLASHFYVGALGANPVSSAWNMMQTILTTIPVIGVKATGQGMGRVFKAAPAYFRARGRGIGHEEAIARTFPEFHRAGLSGAPFAEDVLNSLDRAWTTSLQVPSAAKRPYDRVKAAMMSMFTGTETFVRLTAFEGTMAKAAKEGLSAAQAIPIAARVTQATQFLSGPENIPYMFLQSGPLVKQFGVFGAKYVGFMAGTAQEIGSGAQRGLMGRNWGTLGRAMAGSALAYEAGQELMGQDFTQGLMFGALPSRPPGSLLYPIPWVPPVIGLGAAAIEGVATGDFKSLRRQAPILIPGGVQMARMSTVYAPDVARTIGKQYADYDHPLPDGRIPVMTPEGALRAYMTPMQLHMSAMGIPPNEPGALQKEQELQRYIVAQTEKMRFMKRNFLNALEQNDIRTAIGIRTQFDQLYPGMGGIQITPQDWRAIELRRMVPRLERALENVPADVRPIYGQVISTALAQEAESLMGVDPALLTMPDVTIKKRDPWRQRSASNVVDEVRLRRERMGLLPSSSGATFGAGFNQRRQWRGSRELSELSVGQGAPDLTPF